MQTIVEKAMRVAIIFWDRKFREKPDREIFRIQADEAITELLRQGCSLESIARG